VRRLVEKFSRDESSLSVATNHERVVVTLADHVHELSRGEATALREALGEAMCERVEFFRTAGEYREDGSYVVSRRGANSAGHSKVFESFEQLRRLYERLPREFTAEEVGRTGLTGGRRHILVRHFAEHPAFDCTLAKRQPLTAHKSDAGGGERPR